MNAPVFGLQFIQKDDQAIPIVGANMDVIGLIGPCNSADPDTFPFCRFCRSFPSLADISEKTLSWETLFR